MFLLGVLAPVVLVVSPYALTGSIGDLFEGVFVAPQSRFDYATWDMPHPATLLYAAPVLATLMIRPRLSHKTRQAVDIS